MSPARKKKIAVRDLIRGDVVRLPNGRILEVEEKNGHGSTRFDSAAVLLIDDDMRVYSYGTTYKGEVELIKKSYLRGVKK